MMHMSVAERAASRTTAENGISLLKRLENLV